MGREDYKTLKAELKGWKASVVLTAAILIVLNSVVTVGGLVIIFAMKLIH